MSPYSPEIEARLVSGDPSLTDEELWADKAAVHVKKNPNGCYSYKYQNPCKPCQEEAKRKLLVQETVMINTHGARALACNAFRPSNNRHGAERCSNPGCGWEKEYHR